MKPERWQQVREVLHEAMQMDEAERSVFLDRQCASDPSLRVELKELLAAEGELGSSFLESPALAHAAVHTDNSATGTVLAVGTKLGPYVVQALIGAGGMGEVYRARDGSLKRDVAIKVLPSSFSRDPDRLRRFQLEAEAAAALNHPNILSIYAIGQQDGSPYIVSELLHGETLRDRLRHGPMRLREVLDVGIDIARGLAAAHDAGVVHRDLKPENIFVTKDGRIKILDLGLAKLIPARSASADDLTASFQQQTDPGRVLGTAGYMSPEQVRGEPTDARSDIFAAGAVLYEMLTGKRAFHKATSAETMSAILNDDPPAVSQITSDLSPGLLRIVTRCLAKSPGQRIQHASDLAFALEALSDSGSGGVVSVKEETSAKKGIWIAGGVAVIAIAAAIVVWWKAPPAVPVVESVTQLTDDGQPKLGHVFTDGSRVYFNEGAPGNLKIAQVSIAGGETSIIPTRLSDPTVEGIAPDGSSLLTSNGVSSPRPLWTIPLPTGEPRRQGTIQGAAGTFFPDGRVVFTQGTGLYVAEKDGSNIRKLLNAPYSAYCPDISPDGKSIVLLTRASEEQTFILAEAAADGSGFHEIMRGTNYAPVKCACWAPDGRYLFTRVRENIWLLPMKAGLLDKLSKPIQLTNGPLSYSRPSPGRDGKHIFTIGTKRRGELVRYDIQSQQLTPFLSGISAINPSFSRDGQWVVYTAYPDLTLWRSRMDGTDRLQLTYLPMEVANASISPDGKRVAFATWYPQEIYVIDMDGTSLREIVNKRYPSSPDWSPDGSSLVFNADIEERRGNERSSDQLETIDLKSGKRSVIPSSQGLDNAFWIAPDTLIARPEDSTTLVALDINSGKLTELVSLATVDWSPSLDRKYLYYTTGGAEPKAARMRLADHRVEELASVKDLRRVLDPILGNTQISVAPDGSPIFTRDIGSQEVYALTIKWP